MNTRDNLQFDMFVRIRAFCADHSSAFQRATAAKVLATLIAIIVDLTRLFASQVSGHGTAREAISRADARKALRRSLEAINRSARILAVDAPGFDDKFRLRQHMSDQALLATARAFAQDAGAQADLFIAHELPANLLQDLPGQIEAPGHRVRAPIH